MACSIFKSKYAVSQIPVLAEEKLGIKAQWFSFCNPAGPQKDVHPKDSLMGSEGMHQNVQR